MSHVSMSAGASTPTCTMTGPAVIDFSGYVGFVRDRCAYTLMSVPGLQLLGTFQERRRKDVSFLDHVILRLDQPAVDILLGQGGKVQVSFLQRVMCQFKIVLSEINSTAASNISHMLMILNYTFQLSPTSLRFWSHLQPACLVWEVI